MPRPSFCLCSTMFKTSQEVYDNKSNCWVELACRKVQPPKYEQFPRQHMTVFTVSDRNESWCWLCDNLTFIARLRPRCLPQPSIIMLSDSAISMPLHFWDKLLQQAAVLWAFQLKLPDHTPKLWWKTSKPSAWLLHSYTPPLLSSLLSCLPSLPSSFSALLLFLVTEAFCLTQGMVAGWSHAAVAAGRVGGT